MYNIKYGEIDLRYFGIVTSFKTDLLPSRNINSFSYELMHGVKMLNNKYDSLEMKITIFVEGKTENELEEKLKEIRELFNSEDLVKLTIDDESYYNVITTDKIETERFSNVARYVKITLEALEPYEYENKINLFEQEGDKIVIENNGGEKINPAFSIGISEDTSFVQLQNGKETILIGEYPNFELNKTNQQTTVIKDDCSVMSNWNSATPPIDSNRDTTGVISVNSTNSGFSLNSINDSSSNTWKGACIRRNLTKELDEFEIKAEMVFESTGTNGDPTRPTSDDDSTGSTTLIGTWYKATSSTSYRTGDSTDDRVVGKLKKGDIITPLEITSKGWIKFNWNAGTYYVSPKYMTKIVSRSVNSDIKNYYVTFENPTRIANILSSPKNGKTLASIPTGTLIRCYTTETKHSFTNTLTGENITYTYLKMAKPYNGVTGYILKDYLTVASQVNFTYDEKEDYKYADWKTGQLELYGFSKEGAKLFKVALGDRSIYHESTYPYIHVDGAQVWRDEKIGTTETYYKVNESGEETTLTQYKYLSGAVGQWNRFRGHWNIKRYKKGDNYFYDFKLYKMTNGVYTKTASVSSIPCKNIDKLGYLALYMGTYENMNKCSDMSLEEITVKEINPKPEEETNIIYFHKGDVVDITEDLKVFVNGVSKDELLDVGSRKLNLEIGTSEIQVISDDENIQTSVITQNKWIGGKKC